MDANRIKTHKRWRRKRRIRRNVFGTAQRPRMTVFRSLKNISVQIIDDEQGLTLCQASTLNKDLPADLKSGGNIPSAKGLGLVLAQRAKAAGIDKVVLDRNGYKYHGRIKALADAVREGGLQF